VSSRIYLINESGDLDVMHEQKYENEDVLQLFLQRYPDLLAGDRATTRSPRRWLLISREMGIPDEESAERRWSLDHLFLDQDGIPTLVEVKRSTDTRIRREVVGQLLEYAANAVLYWPIERVKAIFEAERESQGEAGEQAISKALGIPVEDVPSFWGTVETNLRAGRIRLVFFADEIPAELRRIVEFLNEQMNPAEVFAIEVKQFVGSGQTTLVPRIVGRTAAAELAKSGSARVGRKWDEETFLAELGQYVGSGELRVASELIALSARDPFRIWWGEGAVRGSFGPVLDHGDEWYIPFIGNTRGQVQIQFGTLRNRSAYAELDQRTEMLNRLNTIEGANIDSRSVERYPSISMELLTDESSIAQFSEIMDWFVDQVRSV
jgi:hypothetical protein